MMVPVPTDPLLVAQIATLTAEATALRTAIASGVKSASYDGKTVNYDDLDGMKRRLSFIETQLNALITPGYRKPQAGFATFTRGR